MTGRSRDESESRLGQLATELADVTLARWLPTHREQLRMAANDARIPLYMTDRFPHPYRIEDASDFIASSLEHDPPRNFAVMVMGRVAGGVGGEQYGDVLTGTAEIGWWLTPENWGRGITTVVVKRFVRYCFEVLAWRRVEAGVMRPNAASARVAEKAGLRLETILSERYVKNATVHDQLTYGLTRTQWEAGSRG